jgi:hypothetical protein
MDCGNKKNVTVETNSRMLDFYINDGELSWSKCTTRKRNYYTHVISVKRSVG